MITWIEVVQNIVRESRALQRRSDFYFENASHQLQLADDFMAGLYANVKGADARQGCINGALNAASVYTRIRDRIESQIRILTAAEISFQRMSVGEKASQLFDLPDRAGEYHRLFAGESVVSVASTMPVPDDDDEGRGQPSGDSGGLITPDLSLFDWGR